MSRESLPLCLEESLSVPGRKDCSQESLFVKKAFDEEASVKTAYPTLLVPQGLGFMSRSRAGVDSEFVEAVAFDIPRLVGRTSCEAWRLT